MTRKTPQDWQQQLTPEQYRVTREAGTEMPFSGEYYLHEAAGTYYCVCCNHPLFGSDSKFHSGCGWPSFHSELEQANIRQEFDDSHGLRRTELVCSNCDAHLGHIFPDGPQPTGMRYCINSVALRFEPEGQS